ETCGRRKWHGQETMPQREWHGQETVPQRGFPAREVLQKGFDQVQSNVTKNFPTCRCAATTSRGGTGHFRRNASMASFRSVSVTKEGVARDRRPVTFRPRVEVLEDRWLPSTLADYGHLPLAFEAN